MVRLSPTSARLAHFVSPAGSKRAEQSGIHDRPVGSSDPRDDHDPERTNARRTAGEVGRVRTALTPLITNLGA